LFYDSSLNDDIDMGCITGYLTIPYLGQIVDHSSNLMDPVMHFFSRSTMQCSSIPFMA